MVSFLPRIKGAGVSAGFSGWAFNIPDTQQNNSRKPINFIILRNTKLTHFFWYLIFTCNYNFYCKFM